MILDSAAAKALAAIVVFNLYGTQELTSQLPLQVEDAGTSWLVKGTPCTNDQWHLRYYQFHVFFRKSDAEIVGYGTDGRMILDAQKTKYWQERMTPDEFAAIFGPARVFKPWTSDRDIDRVLHLSALGGFINKPDAAIDYARVLMAAADPRLAAIPKESLKAEERHGVWHLTVTHAEGFASNSEILTLSRTTGKLLSGHLGSTPLTLR